MSTFLATFVLASTTALGQPPCHCLVSTPQNVPQQVHLQIKFVSWSEFKSLNLTPIALSDRRAPRYNVPGVNTASEIENVMKAVREEPTSSILSDSRAITLNGRPARLQIGQIEEHTVGVRVEQHNGRIVLVPQVKTFDTGIKCSVTPTVLANGNIIDMAVEVEHAEARINKDNASPVLTNVKTANLKKVGGLHNIMIARPTFQVRRQQFHIRVKPNQYFVRKVCALGDGTNSLLMIVCPKVIAAKKSVTAPRRHRPRDLPAPRKAANNRTVEIATHVAVFDPTIANAIVRQVQPNAKQRFDFAKGAKLVGLLSEQQARQFVQIVQRRRSANIVQSPRITVMDGREGVFQTGADQFIGARVTTVPGAKNFDLSQLRAQFIGTKLTYLPKASKNGQTINVNLRYYHSEMNPSVPMVPKFVPVPQEPSDVKQVRYAQPNKKPRMKQIMVPQPSIRAQQIAMSLAIPKGKTALIYAGTREVESRREVTPPILKAIPYAGRMFRNVHISRESRAVFLLVRPKLNEPRNNALPKHHQTDVETLRRILFTP